MKKRRDKVGPSDVLPPEVNPPDSGSLPVGPTGRKIITLRPGGPKSHIKALQDTAGLKIASSADFDQGAVNEAAIGGADAILLEYLDLAIVDADADQVASLEEAVADESNPVMSVEPEMYARAYDQLEGQPSQGFLTPAGREYFRGYSEAIQVLVGRLLAGETEAGAPAATTTFADTATLTWGLQAIGADASSYTGSGIRVAVLDTGFDFNHPDFAGRSIVSASFVPGLNAQDGHSHGTHCIGTACGPKTPPGGTRRYGVAGQTTILVGKVLNNSGSGQTGWILAGINWAIQNKAAIISMSLGSPVAVEQTFSPAYEQAAQAALNANCLIVAAAGNDGPNVPVGSPANCPSVMAVAVLDNNLQRASFSCIGLNPNGGEVNVAAPGVAVFSTVPMPARYGLKSGTSMATPHVAGTAALWAQSTGFRGMALWQKLVSTTQNVGLPAAQAGSGLAQAPKMLMIRPFPWPWKVRLPIHFPTPPEGPINA